MSPVPRIPSLRDVLQTPVRRKYFDSLSRILGSTGLASMREEQFFLVLAILIGIASGLCVVLFRVAIEGTRLALLGSSLHPSAPRVFLVPALVGLLVAFLVIRFFPRVRGSGINQTKAALYIYDGYIAPDTIVGKFLLSALSIGSGQSLGPEDPSLQIGAGLASALGRWLKLSRERLRLIAPVGAAAGLAAAFNSPITAVLFVIEEVIGRWSAGILGAVVLSAISSVVVERWFLGDEALFRVPQYHLAHAGELLAYAVLGLAGGIASIVFVKALQVIRPRLRRLPAWTFYVQPAIAGLIIGLIGLRFPQVMGAGYEYMDLAMHSRYTWELLGILAGLKILATCLSFASGSPGGLFAPSLFIGAMLGGAVGLVTQQVFPQLQVSVGAYALVGMGTLFAGMLRAPLTSVFMILEISGNYSIILPVIISNTIAYLVSRSVQPTPLFDLLSRQDGIDLPSLEEERELSVLRVEDAMRPPTVRPLLAEEPLGVARQLVSQSDRQLFLVSHGGGTWSGLTRETVLGSELDEAIPISSLFGPVLPYLYADQSLDVALRIMGDFPLLPVVHRANPRQLVGIVSLADILSTYRNGENETGK